MDALYEKAIDSKPDIQEKLNLIKSVQGLPINILALVDDQVNISKVDTIFTEQESVLLKELRKIVTETNLLSISMILEDIDMRYAKLVALCLYANKLEAASTHRYWLSNITSNEVNNLFYQLTERDVLEDIIDDQSMINQVNESFNKHKGILPKHIRDVLMINI